MTGACVDTQPPFLRTVNGAVLCATLFAYSALTVGGTLVRRKDGMHRQLSMVLALLCVTIGGVSATPSRPDVHPGLWEISVTMNVPGMPIALPAIKQQHCVTRHDLVPPTTQPGQQCQLLDHSVSANTVTWNMACKEGETVMHGHGTVTYTADEFKGQVEMTMQGGTGNAMHMTSSLSGRRIGECQK